MKNVVKNNQFTGVHWDKDATEAVTTVAKALLNLTELFKSQNISIECMVRMDAENKEDK